MPVHATAARRSVRLTKRRIEPEGVILVIPGTPPPVPSWPLNPWDANEFKRVTTGKKVYRPHRFDDDTCRKVRVYPVVIRPAEASTAAAVVVQMPEARRVVA